MYCGVVLELEVIGAKLTPFRFSHTGRTAIRRFSLAPGRFFATAHAVAAAKKYVFRATSCTAEDPEQNGHPHERHDTSSKEFMYVFGLCIEWRSGDAMIQLREPRSSFLGCSRTILHLCGDGDYPFLLC